ncbi:MAG TPA: M20/M25/M40 family metallo-hydrolase [Longimicrobiales bacterium]|nr:M20/M25/M40 family metallo-hydrolase [Longimicrobiales bacterium]
MFAHRFILLSAAVLVGACATPVQQVQVTPTAGVTTAADLDRATATIQPRDFHARIGLLASNALQGRDTPSPGLEAAAAWIESEFFRLGLEPAGTDGYMQRWPYETRALDASATRLELHAGNARRTLSYGSDFYAAAGTRPPFSGGIVFTGQAVPPEDVRQDGLRGRAVAIHMPQLSVLAVNRARAEADAAGAAAVIVLLPADVTEENIAAAAAAAERPTRATPAVPVFYLRDDRARELFRDANLDYDALTRGEGARAPLALAGVTAHVGAPVHTTTHMPPNVVAMLPGSDPVLRHTYLIFSAHFDHVGVAGTGGGCTAIGDNIICNGADDNASGTSTILEIAEAFASLPAPPRRSVIFLAVSGEEKGLLGSRYYADNPTVERDSIVANINMDMVGRSPHPDTVAVIGQSFSSLGPLVQEVAAAMPELRLTVMDDMWPGQNLLFRSDQLHFLRHEIPAVFFFTGLHEEYHRPTDEPHLIDLDQITRIGRLGFRVGHAIADDANRPQWVPAGLEEVRRLTGGR